LFDFDASLETSELKSRVALEIAPGNVIGI
jgi:hypothetical protein